MSEDDFIKKICQEKGFDNLDELIRYYSILLSYENEGNIYNILTELFNNANNR